MNAFYDWNILLDSEGGPNHTQNYCEAPYMYDLNTGKLMKRKCLDYYRHFAYFIKPGAVRLACTRYTDQLDMTAWENTDGSRIFVLLNRSTEAKKCFLRTEGEMFEFVIPSNSILSGILENDHE